MAFALASSQSYKLASKESVARLAGGFYRCYVAELSISVKYHS